MIILPLRIVVVLPPRSVVWFRLHANFCYSELWLFYFCLHTIILPPGCVVAFPPTSHFLPPRSVVVLPAKIFNYFCLHNIFCHPVFWPFTTRKGWLTFAYIALSGSQKCGRFTTPMCGKHIRLNSNFCHPWAWLFTTRIVALYHQDCGSLPPGLWLLTTQKRGLYFHLCTIFTTKKHVSISFTECFCHPDVFYFNRARSTYRSARTPSVAPPRTKLQKRTSFYLKAFLPQYQRRRRLHRELAWRKQQVLPTNFTVTLKHLQTGYTHGTVTSLLSVMSYFWPLLYPVG